MDVKNGANYTSYINYINYMIIGLCVVIIILGYLNKYCNCPPPQIVYRIVNTTPLDYQFSTQNLPSQNYDELFNRDNSWIGGYNLNYSKKVRSK